jgi:hypothetical protein
MLTHFSLLAEDLKYKKDFQYLQVSFPVMLEFYYGVYLIDLINLIII